MSDIDVVKVIRERVEERTGEPPNDSEVLKILQSNIKSKLTDSQALALVVPEEGSHE